MSKTVIASGYEPSILTVHPPPRTAGGVFFCIGVYSVPKNVLKGKPEYFGVIHVKRPKNMVFQHIHSNHIFINLTLFNNIE